MFSAAALLSALPFAAYVTDAEGLITDFNSAAVALWGVRPEPGSARWAGPARMFRLDGLPLPPDECPVATTLRLGREVRGVELLVERADGARIAVVPQPVLVRSDDGTVDGVVCTLVEVHDQRRAETEAARLAAIVSSSDDAIISKTLDGRITSWNAAASRIFGYAAEEMIGQSILRLIPDELRAEEDIIISKLVRGERIEHFDTVRCAKDGRRVNVSLTVSPMKDRGGNIIGASKVARDITDRKRAEELQALLFDELNHRVKNTLAIIQAMASQSLRRAASPEDFVTSFNGRVQALARAHDLLVGGKMQGADVMELVRDQVALGSGEGSRISCSGPLVVLEPRGATQLALVLHELATNARKYGALSLPSGRLGIEWQVEDRRDGRVLCLAWRESGVPSVVAPVDHGFGTTLIERTLTASGGTAQLRYGSDGIVCDICLPLPVAVPSGLDATERERRAAVPASAATAAGGRRVLLIEDEPLVAMDIEMQLQDAGYLVVGPAASVEAAHRLIESEEVDLALLDANLAGRPVGEVAAALKRRGIPFAFATGYGREGLPSGFRDHPVLGKPFSQEQLRQVLQGLGQVPAASGVLPFRPRGGMLA